MMKLKMYLCISRPDSAVRGPLPDSKNTDICTHQLSLQVETQPSSCPWMCRSGLEHTSQTAYVSKGLREGLLDLIMGVGAYAVSVYINLAEDV